MPHGDGLPNLREDSRNPRWGIRTIPVGPYSFLNPDSAISPVYKVLGSSQQGVLLRPQCSARYRSPSSADLGRHHRVW